MPMTLVSSAYSKEAEVTSSPVPLNLTVWIVDPVFLSPVYIFAS
jgi:hypothetical protein